MFTVRVEHDRSKRTVFQCQRYKVHEETTRIRLMLDELGDYSKIEQIFIVNGGAAYVMNEQGVTVDIVRLKK